jgi:hypothetical protein
MESPSVIELSYLPDTPSDGRNTKHVNSSSNFGGGIELLMNDKIKHGQSSKGSSSGLDDIEDLSKLEFELNELTNDDFKGPTIHSEPVKSTRPGDVRFANIFSSNESTKSDENPVININSTLGDSTAFSSSGSSSENTTWDGYSKLNTTINPDKAFATPDSTMSKEELLREKFKILKKIETLERKGVEFTKKYNMDSPLSEMTGEYETVMDERFKLNSIKFQGNMLISIVNGIEYLNNKLDYLDVKLDGWSEQVNDNLNDYDDIFGELYDQYKDKTSISPWVRLLFQVGGSAFMVHLSNTMFKSAMPSMDDIFRQNPDLMKSFQSAAINTMGKTSPGLAGFMNGVTSGMGGGGGPPTRDTFSQNHGPPSQSYDDYISQTRGGNNLYGVNTTSIHTPPIPPSNGYSRQVPLKTPINQYPQSSNQPDAHSLNTGPINRPEMKGPNDINDILSRIKTKPPQSHPTQSVNTQLNSVPIIGKEYNQNESSTISLSELSEIHSDVNVPKKSRRKPKSDKNTISLSL